MTYEQLLDAISQGDRRAALDWFKSTTTSVASLAEVANSLKCRPEQVPFAVIRQLLRVNELQAELIDVLRKKEGA